MLGVNGGIEPVRAADLGGLARRPRFCALSSQKLDSLGLAIPTWQSAVQRHLTKRGVNASREAFAHERDPSRQAEVALNADLQTAVQPGDTNVVREGFT